MPRYKHSLVACARWEESQIQEWVEYHRSIGFDHIYLYSNDDDPAALFKAVAAYLHGRDPFVTFRHWPVAGEQAAIYFHYLETFKHETEWFSFLDIDEFFVLKGVENITDFMRNYEDSVDCLYFQWMIYGNCDRRRRADGPTLTSYLRHASNVDYHTKMLCRSSAIDPVAIRRGHEAGLGAFWHFLDKYRLPGVRYRDVLHEKMDGYAYDFPASTARFINRTGLAQALLDTAYIAHFQFRSEEDFIRRWRRGGFPNGDFWRGAYEAGIHKDILAKSNEIYDPYLADYWHRYTSAGLRLTAPDRQFDNVALNKPAWQSSEFEPGDAGPPGSRTSGRGNNGVRCGSYGFHTESEPRPWWIVDLLSMHWISEIHVYNRTDTAEAAQQAAALDILGSDDGAAWTTLHSNFSATLGLDGQPLVVRPAQGAYRFIMLRLRGSGFLHLDDVGIYGNPSDRQIPLIGTALSTSGLK